MTGPCLGHAAEGGKASTLGGNGARIDHNGATAPSSFPTFTGREDDQRHEIVFAMEQQQLHQRLQLQLQQLLDAHHTAISSFFEQSSACLKQHLQQEIQDQQLKANQLQSNGMSGLPPVLQSEFHSAATSDSASASGAAIAAEAVAAVGAAAGAADDEARADTTATESEIQRSSRRKSQTPRTPHSDGVRSKHLKPIFSSHSQLELSAPLDARIRLRLRGRMIRSFFGLCILANAIVMFVHLQWLGSIANERLGLDNDIDSWGSPQGTFQAFEYVFAVIFLAELVLNVYAFRWRWFEEIFNVADAFIVVVTTLETFVLQPLAANVQNISFLRLLRIAKMIRAMRVFRMLGLFDSIQTLIATIIHSTWSLIGSLVIMFVLMLMCSIFLSHSLHDFVISEAEDLATRTWVNSMFGSGDKALYTVFEMTFSGCWPNYASRVVKSVSPFYAGFFGIYVSFVIFGLVRIISALFLRETMQQAARDADIIIRERGKKTRRIKTELAELFGRADVSNDGQLSFEEMEDLMEIPKVQLWLGELGIDGSDARTLFELIDHDGNGEISRDEFVEGMTRLKGEARAQDLVPLVTNSKRMLGQCKEILRTVQHVAATLGRQPPSGPHVAVSNWRCESRWASPEPVVL